MCGIPRPCRSIPPQVVQRTSEYRIVGVTSALPNHSYPQFPHRRHPPFLLRFSFECGSIAKKSSTSPITSPRLYLRSSFWRRPQSKVPVNVVVSRVELAPVDHTATDLDRDFNLADSAAIRGLGKVSARRIAILRQLDRFGGAARLATHGLARMFDTTAQSISRDLAWLRERGAIQMVRWARWTSGGRGNRVAEYRLAAKILVAGAIWTVAQAVVALLRSAAESTIARGRRVEHSGARSEGSRMPGDFLDARGGPCPLLLISDEVVFSPRAG